MSFTLIKIPVGSISKVFNLKACITLKIRTLVVSFGTLKKSANNSLYKMEENDFMNKKWFS